MPKPIGFRFVKIDIQKNYFNYDLKVAANT